MKQLELFEPKTLWMSKDYLIIMKYYPHVADNIETYWENLAQTISYLDNLLLDTRNGERKGFPPKHAACLLNLISFRKYLANENCQD